VQVKENETNLAERDLERATFATFPRRSVSFLVIVGKDDLEGMSVADEGASELLGSVAILNGTPSRRRFRNRNEGKR